MIDSDCQIPDVPNAICSGDLKCVNPKAATIHESDAIHNWDDFENVGRIKLDDSCSKDDDCKSLGEAECSKQRHCICKIGYYPNANNGLCLAGFWILK